MSHRNCGQKSKRSQGGFCLKVISNQTRSHIHSTPITEGAIARTGRADRIKWSRVVN
ncbi:hypothetical protein [Coleofasciculus sp. F4-SAH-05]|uniref:hypothetical protein n=1 Tax=Coleofasciculus sp. F4-SAH-05 TaxID=3069525 RepID=UPI0032F78A9D